MYFWQNVLHMLFIFKKFFFFCRFCVMRQVVVILARLCFAAFVANFNVK